MPPAQTSRGHAQDSARWHLSSDADDAEIPAPNAETAGAPGAPSSPGLTGAGAMAAEDERESSLLGQFGRTRASFLRLFRAHVALAMAEKDEILDQVKVLAGIAGVVFVLALLAGNMLYIGGFLFLGEWLFGSMGWGLAHGILFAVAMIVVLVTTMLGASARVAVSSFALALVLTIGIAVLLWSNVVHFGLESVARQLTAPFNTGEALAFVIGALLLGLLMLIVLFRARDSFSGLDGLALALAVLLVVAIVGGILGFVLGSTWTLAPAIGFAITVGLLGWIVIQIARARGLDPVERFARLKPQQSIDAANETRAWLEEQWRNRRPTLGRK